MIVFFALVLLVYALTIAQLVYGFGKVRPYVTKCDAVPKTFFSIVVPFRNERENLPVLLDSIRKLQYPIDLFEIILVDDFSMRQLKMIRCDSSTIGAWKTALFSLPYSKTSR